MNLEKDICEEYEEFVYINTQKSKHYRTIVRYMYNELQRKEFIYRFDLFEYMKQFDEFVTYTEDECYKDLDFLCEKGNILKYKNDYSTIKSIEEIKKKKFRYQLTERTRMIEELLINRFNEINAITVVLDRNLLKNLKKELLKLLERKSEFLEMDSKELYSWWNSIERAFGEIRKNYITYIQDVNSFEYEKMLDSDEFLLKKTRLKEYLEEFIASLIEESGEIKKILIKLNKSEEFDKLLEKIINYDYEINSMTKNSKKDKSRKKVYNTKTKIYNWFVGENDDNEVEYLRKNTITVINKIIKLAKKFISKRLVNYSRKESYKKAAKSVLTCDNIEDAHKFAGILFGVSGVKHLRGDFSGKSEEKVLDVENEDKLYIELRKLSERKHEKKKIFFEDRSIDKANYMMQKEAEKVKQKSEMERYIQNNILEIEKLPKVNKYTKNIILEYIKKGLGRPMNQKENIIVVNDKLYKQYNLIEFNNQLFKLLVPCEESERCVMRTEDGDLEMPSFIIKFGDKR